MAKIKSVTLVLLTLLIFSCGGTKKEEIDYSQITDAEMLQLANQDFKEGKYKEAIDKYNRLLLEFPTSNLHIDAQLKIAESYGKMDKYERQMEQLYRLVRENIIPERVPKIYVQIGKFYERAAQFNPGIITSDSTDYNKALKYYEMALKYPDSDDTVAKSEAVYRRGLVEAKIGQIDDAISRYNLVSNMYPNSDFSILAQMKLKDPSDVSELSMSDSAMTTYKQALGLITVASDEDEDESDAEESAAPAEDTNLNQTIENLDKESTADPETDQQAPVDENMEIQQPDANPDATPAESDTLEPAVEDTTDF